MIAFLVSGGYLLVWPIYRLFHRTKTAAQGSAVSALSGGVLSLCSAYRIRDLRFPAISRFSSRVLSLRDRLSVYGLFFWIVTYCVWADSDPDVWL